MNLKAGLLYLTIVFGGSSGAIVEYHIDKSGIELKCEDVAKISTNGFTFYACEKDVNPELLNKLGYMATIKKYGVEQLGLKKTINYQIYKDGTDEKPITWHWLYVTSKTEIPQKWKNCRHIAEDGEHRLVIKEATLFCSKNDNLLDEKEHYSEMGFDTYWRSFTNFAILGGGCNFDPNFLEQSAAEQAVDILHENFHVTVDKERGLEESFATLIGRAGAAEFTKLFFGEDSKEHQEAKRTLEFRLDFSKDVIETNSKLLELYKKDIPLEEKLAEKEKILDGSRHTNNAEIWDRLPYTKNFPLVYEVYKKHPDLNELVQIFIDCPPTEEEGIEYLEGLL